MQMTIKQALTQLKNIVATTQNLFACKSFAPQNIQPIKKAINSITSL